jgi:hypothetical protein
MNIGDLAAVATVVGWIVLCLWFALGAPVASGAIARTPEAIAFERKVRSAEIGAKWEPVVRLYSGSNYGVGYLNRLWAYCPKGSRRGVMLREAVEHRIPFRLLLAVYGAESSYGRARSYFGLTGYFPGRGTSGSFDRDAHLAAALWSKLYRIRYGRTAL